MSEERIWECIIELQGIADDMHKEIDKLKSRIKHLEYHVIPKQIEPKIIK